MRAEPPGAQRVGAAGAGMAGAEARQDAQQTCHSWRGFEPGAWTGLASPAPWQSAPVASGGGMAEDAAATPARNTCSTISHTATITMQWNGCAAGRVGTGTSRMAP